LSIGRAESTIKNQQSTTNRKSKIT